MIRREMKSKIMGTSKGFIAILKESEESTVRALNKHINDNKKNYQLNYIESVHSSFLASAGFVGESAVNHIDDYSFYKILNFDQNNIHDLTAKVFAMKGNMKTINKSFSNSYKNGEAVDKSSSVPCKNGEAVDGNLTLFSGTGNSQDEGEQ
ncbi:hypothetical protein H206_01691 [Candidatus Electrothrix aarhusensis]|uniref:Uncharacterized protein n=1 Tax=Candidatus Electrothrix aarhusensis TaxID=1859131 RepID=A0A444IUD0_9BACT|nr:hypothetical protein H206_01691 [Candidatus Electrothrix aarhusensis]